MRRVLMFSVFVSLVVFVTLAIVGAQSSTGTVRGVVKDASGAVVPGVTVRIADRVATTNVKGEFVIVGLKPGFYEVIAELQGFTTWRTVTQVTGDHVSNVSIELRVGGVNETVTVTGQTP